MSQTFFWVGHHAGLDFVNTEAVGGGGEPLDLLPTWTDLVAWARQAKLIDARQARACAAQSDPDGRDVLGWAKQLRAALRGVLDPDARELDAAGRLDAAVAAVPVRLGFTEPEGSRVYPTADAGPLATMQLALAAAALDATELDRARVRRCEGATCVLLYHDSTKNHSRRWCDMAVCGNRAKAAAHYRRTRGRRSD